MKLIGHWQWGDFGEKRDWNIRRIVPIRILVKGMYDRIPIDWKSHWRILPPLDMHGCDWRRSNRMLIFVVIVHRMIPVRYRFFKVYRRKYQPIRVAYRRAPCFVNLPAIGRKRRRRFSALDGRFRYGKITPCIRWRCDWKDQQQPNTWRLKNPRATTITISSSPLLRLLHLGGVHQPTLQDYTLTHHQNTMSLSFYASDDINCFHTLLLLPKFQEHTPGLSPMCRKHGMDVGWRVQFLSRYNDLTTCKIWYSTYLKILSLSAPGTHGRTGRYCTIFGILEYGMLVGHVVKTIHSDLPALGPIYASARLQRKK